MYQILLCGILGIFMACSPLRSAIKSDEEYAKLLESSREVSEAARREALSKAQELKRKRLKVKAPNQRAGLGLVSSIGSTAVIVVDIQRDFTVQPFDGNPTGGNLKVNHTEADYTDAASAFVEKLRKDGCLIAFTQDWHPLKHVSFLSRWSGEKGRDGKEPGAFQPFAMPERKDVQVMWPDHCIQESKGAEIIVPVVIKDDIVVKKGMSSDFDSYSGFEDKDGKKTAMEEVLDILSIKNLIVIGIATDYCVKDTVIDALKVKKSKKSRYNVYVIVNLCRGVAPDTSIQAFKDMEKAGAVLYWINNLGEGDSRKTESLEQLQDEGLTINVADDIDDFLKKASVKPSLEARVRRVKARRV